jgi:NADH-quinone oxidoreductase subunit G
MKINGVEHDFPNGMNVLEACKQIGVHVPHFCYHPALKVVGSCRMCKVEVTQRGMSKIDVSCNLTVAEGLEVNTDTPAVRKQQQMTLEYLLANHPLDCPICDDAGECDLQNYYLDHGRHDSRLHEIKHHKKHKATDIGKSVVLDNERCVLCTRCVRFTQDVTRTHELGVFGMGHTEELALTPGKRLDNDYSGNVVDLCPVGALTDKDFRFKRRVWFLSSKPSVCQGCSRGCNVRIDYDINPFHVHKKTFMMKTHRTPATTYQRIQRLKPRYNDGVNGHWICDAGRYGYKPTDWADRCLTPLVREGDELKETTWSDALSKLASGLTSGGAKTAVVASPKLTNEELFAVWSLFRGKLKIASLDHRLPADPEWYGDDLLRTPDPFPNRIGAEWIGLTPEAGGVGVDGLEEAVRSGLIDTLVAVLADPTELLTAEALKKLKRIYLVARNASDAMKSAAHLILPAAAWGEYRGTFTNFRGRTQRLEAAFEPLGESKPVWQIATELSTVLKKPLGWQTHPEVFHAMAQAVFNYNGFTWETIGDQGITLGVVGARAAG